MTGGIPAHGEFAIIEGWKDRLPAPPAGEVWIGDDAAVVTAGPGPWLLTADMSVAGVHADMALLSVQDLGWRAVAAAVSDIAAMGGRPRHLLVAMAGPPDTDVDALCTGVAAAAEAHGCHLVGGDMSNADQVVVAVTVTGVVGDGPGAVGRGGARPGHGLFLTGPVGASAAGLRILRTHGGDPVHPAAGEAAAVAAHRRPRARLAEGAAARRAGASAMIDVSDGLVADLGHLATASGVGVELDDVPMAPTATETEALAGGEDYELVFAAPDATAVWTGFAAAGLTPPLRIGTCTSDVGRREWNGSTLPGGGWEHRWG